MKRTQILNKPVYLNLSILEMSKTVIYVFWYNNVKLWGKKQDYVTRIHTVL